MAKLLSDRSEFEAKKFRRRKGDEMPVEVEQRINELTTTILDNLYPRQFDMKTQESRNNFQEKSIKSEQDEADLGANQSDESRPMEYLKQRTKCLDVRLAAKANKSLLLILIISTLVSFWPTNQFHSIGQHGFFSICDKITRSRASGRLCRGQPRAAWPLFVTFANAEVLTDLENSASTTKHFHLSKATATALATRITNSIRMTNDPIPARAVFLRRPNEVTEVTEGQTAVFGCKTQTQFPYREWHTDKHGNLFDDDNFQIKAPLYLKDRLNFIGNLSSNDYSIEINAVTKEDEDIYRCRALPDLPDYKDNDPRWEVFTVLRVLPRQPLTIPPSIQELSSTVREATHHEYSSGHHQSAASLENTNNNGQSEPFETSRSPSMRTPMLSNNNKAREALPGARLLDPSNHITTIPGGSSGSLFISPISSSSSSSAAYVNSYNGNQLTARASTAYPSVSSSSSNHSIHLASGALIWPYLLLALAALLMLANVYLIYSLIKRHTRCSKENEANERNHHRHNNHHHHHHHRDNDDAELEDHDPSMA